MKSASPTDAFAPLRAFLRQIRRRIVLLTLLRLPRADRREREFWATGWGWYRRPSAKGGVWIHASTIGEVRIALSVIQSLPAELPLVITTFDVESAVAAERLLRGRAAVTAFPAPFRFAMRRFVEHFDPRRLIIIETQFYPLIVLAAVRPNLPAAVVSMFNDQQQIELFLPLLRSVELFGVRLEEDRRKLVEHGIPIARIGVTGDLKFDALALEPRRDLEVALRGLAGDRPILIAGSTHPEEEPAVLDAFEQLGGGRRALLLLAPRVPTLGKSEALLRQRGIDYRKRTKLPVKGRPAVVLLDSIGELPSLYRLAAAAFVGGSMMLGGGGHSPLEAARSAVPVAVGPNMSNFRLIAEIFDRAGAWTRVTNADDLARAWTTWLDNPEAAQTLGKCAAELVQAHQGALTRTLDLLQTFLGQSDALGPAVKTPATRLRWPQAPVIEGLRPPAAIP